MMHEVRITFRFSPQIARWSLVLIALVVFPLELGSESLTLSTTYPSPAGVYSNMIVTNLLTVGNLNPLPGPDPAIAVSKPGMIYYNNSSNPGTFKGFNGTAWTALGGAGFSTCVPANQVCPWVVGDVYDLDGRGGAYDCSVGCNAGWKLVSGGFYAGGYCDSQVIGNFPDSSSGSLKWRCVKDRNDCAGPNQGITCYALCCQ